VDPVAQCSVIGGAGQIGMAVDDQRPVHLQILLQRPFRGCVGIKFLKAQLEVLCALKGEVFYLASLSGQVLNRRETCTARTPSPCALLVVRSVGGDDDALTNWMSLRQDDLA
jgi:hypothetical protein